MLRNRARGYTERAQLWTRAGPAPVTRLALRPCQRLHDGAGDKQRDDRDELADEDRPIQVDRRAPLGLAILDHPCPGGARANAEAGAAVPGRVATSSAAAHHAGGGRDGDAVFLNRFAIDHTYRVQLHSLDR